MKDLKQIIIHASLPQAFFVLLARQTERHFLAKKATLTDWLPHVLQAEKAHQPFGKHHLLCYQSHMHQDGGCHDEV
jgi:hypothetical protein